EVSAIAIEYGMYGGRFWLPRLRSAEGVGKASFVTVPFRMEQSFKYEAVNSGETLPAVPARLGIHAPDSLKGPALTAWWDSVMSARRAVARARRDSVRVGQLPRAALIPVQACDTADTK